MRYGWILVVLAICLAAMLPADVQAKAELSGSTINIWSEGGNHVQTCATLLSDVPTKVKACVSKFASTCISVDASINITRGGATNWTNFSVNGCEIRMNETRIFKNFITSWGNFTVLKGNITSNNSDYPSEINISANSNFSMIDSFIGQMGYYSSPEVTNGLDIHTPVFLFNNNTFTQGSSSYAENDLALLSGSNGSVITNVNFIQSNQHAIYLEQTSNNTFINVTAKNGGNGIQLYKTRNNTFKNINSSNNGDTYGEGILILYDANNNIFNNITVNSNLVGLYVTGYNNTFTNVTANKNQNNGIQIVDSADCYFQNINASSNLIAITIQRTNNSIFDNINGSSNYYYGLYITESSTNNTFTNYTANSNSYFGIASDAGFNNTFNNITAKLNGWSGIYIGSSFNYTIKNVNSSSNNQYGIQTGYSGENTYANITAAYNLLGGISLQSGANNNTFTNMNLLSNTNYGISISTSSNNTFASGTVNKSQYNVYADGGDKNIFKDMNLLNPTYLDVKIFNDNYDSCKRNGAGLTSCGDITDQTLCAGSPPTTAPFPNCNWHYCDGILTGGCSSLGTESSCGDTNGHCSWDGFNCNNVDLTSCSQIGQSSCIYVQGCNLYECDGTLTGGCTDITNEYTCGNTNGHCNWDGAVCQNVDLTACLQLQNLACTSVQSCNYATPNCIGTLAANCETNITTGYQCDSLTNGKCFSGFDSIKSNIFLNVSYTNESVGGATTVGDNITLLRQWYADFYTNKSSGSPLSGANISVWNNTGNLVDSGLTNSTGWSARFNITQYINRSRITTYANNHTIYANKSGYANNTKNLSLSGNIINGAFFITLDPRAIIVNPITPDSLNSADDTPDFVFNATDNMRSTFNCSLYISGAIYGYNATTVNNSNTTITANKVLPRGSYNWYIGCNDSDGIYGTSDARAILIKVGHVINLVLQINGTYGNVYIPGTGETFVTSLSNSSYPSPAHRYVASYFNGVLRSLVFVSGDFVSMEFARSGTYMHTIGMNLDLQDVSVLLPFTKGDWNNVDNRIKDVESGSFFAYINPTFGLGLGNIYTVKIMLKYPDINIAGNLIMGMGQQGISIAYNGTSNNKQSILITQVNS